MVRTKFRYILFELQFFSTGDNDHPTDGSKGQDTLANLNPNFVPLQSSHVFHHVNDKAAEIFGDVASAEMLVGFQVKYFNPYTGVGVIRSRFSHYRQIWATLTLISNFRNRACYFRVISVTGTMVKCQRQAIELSRQTILRWNQSKEKPIPLPLMKNTLEQLEEDILEATGKV
ncbi:RNA-binding protein pop5 [Dispira parvispora]|uniref:RNA-binding protein pop5 n=1 Tax=Dispira parvispora TaxID=1520584 RepID=A0A9W8AU50_9FUNG|nr:RNA-binding protein pop5 [Dispira parvispora]